MFTKLKTHAGVPSVFSLDPSAFVAHLTVDDVLHHEGLLQDGGRVGNFTLNCQFNLENRPKWFTNYKQ
jgi:hypothetical protein